MNAQFVVDVEGRKTAVVLSIDDFRALVERLEELEDLRLIEERRSEPRIAISSLEELLAAVEAPHQPERP
ncbi:MAG: hypothetical protein ACREV1_16285 [Gammaproteobacteria bacterium]